jgi:solute carrier family 39 (zinc transporter), member 1/2/3
VTLVLYKIIIALFIFLVSLITAIYPLSKKKVLQATTGSAELGEGLASGIFLGAAFFHMLPDAMRSFAQLYPEATYPTPALVCISSFTLLLFLERLSLAYTSVRAKQSIPYILALILVIHALTEGAVLGIGATFSEALLLSIAIIAHKGSEGFALCTHLLRHQLPFKRILWIVVFFSLMTPLGISLGTVANIFTLSAHGVLIEALFNAFAAGTFLYISTLHHLRFHQHLQEGSQGLREFACLLLGLVMMGVMAWWT